jgi:hypothetical protein
MFNVCNTIRKNETQ